MWTACTGQPTTHTTSNWSESQFALFAPFLKVIYYRLLRSDFSFSPYVLIYWYTSNQIDSHSLLTFHHERISFIISLGWYYNNYHKHSFDMMPQCEVNTIWTPHLGRLPQLVTVWTINYAHLTVTVSCKRVNRLSSQASLDQCESWVGGQGNLCGDLGVVWHMIFIHWQNSQGGRERTTIYMIYVYFDRSN